jgi:7-carboxy-7-deazaguanine synthase
MSPRLRITEIFYSLQGEARTVGWPTVFVRLTGCPLRCGYCDTEYAFSGGNWLSLDEILNEVAVHGAHYVTVTGGEPLAQPETPELLRRLCNAGYVVSLETSGSREISGLDDRVSVVMDLKTPGSGELDKNLYENINALDGNDQVKFVITDRADYEWSRGQLVEHQLDSKCEVLFSPVSESLDAKSLAQWILEDRLPVRMQLQLHKIIWGDERGR